MGKKSIAEIINHLTTGFNLLVNIPFLGKIIQHAGDRGGEVLIKKMGLSAEEADKTYNDEGLFELALIKSNLEEDEKKVVKGYIRRLRKTNMDLSKEWVRWVYNIMTQFGRQTKAPSGNKKNDTYKETSFTDYSEGIEAVSELFKDIATAVDDQEREEHLLTRNIQVKKKEDPPLKTFFKEKIPAAERGNREDITLKAAGWREKSKNWRERRQ